MTQWLPKWVAKDFRGVSNTDLIKRLMELCKDRKIEWQHTPAHVGVLGNERADQLARRACEVSRTAAASSSAGAKVAVAPSPTNVNIIKERLKTLNSRATSGAKTKAKVTALVQDDAASTEEATPVSTKISFRDNDGDDGDDGDDDNCEDEEVV